MITEHILSGGGFPVPLNGIKRIKIEYMQGNQIIIEGGILNLFYQELSHMLSVTSQIEAAAYAQAHEEPEITTSEDLIGVYDDENYGKIVRQTEDDDEDS